MPLLLSFDDYDDKACPVCYWGHLRDYLNVVDRTQLWMVGKECSCDFTVPGPGPQPSSPPNEQGEVESCSTTTESQGSEPALN